MSTTVDFWFDPGCPFTWRTSRWLSEVARRRGLVVTWHLMSRHELNKAKDLPPEQRARYQASHQIGLVLEAVRQEHGNAMLAAAYTSIGTRLHDSNQQPDDGTMAAALADEGLPHRLIDHGRREQVAAGLIRSHQQGQAAVGQESGTPIIAIDGRPGFFGPVVVPIPTGDEADRLFDAVVLISQVPAFSELKRARKPF